MFRFFSRIFRKRPQSAAAEVVAGRVTLSDLSAAEARLAEARLIGFFLIGMLSGFVDRFRPLLLVFILAYLTELHWYVLDIISPLIWYALDILALIFLMILCRSDASSSESGWPWGGRRRGVHTNGQSSSLH